METSAHFEIAEIDLVYNAPKDLAQRPRVAKASEASVIFKTTWDKGKIGFVEQFKILLLNRMYKVLGICTIATGGMTATIVDIRLVMAAALKSGAVQMIVAHNHPYGNLNPSEADRSEEHTSELQYLMRIPYAVVCLNKKNRTNNQHK